MLQSRFVVDLLLGLLAVAVGVVGAAVAVAVASRTAAVFFPEWHSRFRENAAPAQKCAPTFALLSLSMIRMEGTQLAASSLCFTVCLS